LPAAEEFENRAAGRRSPLQFVGSVGIPRCAREFARHEHNLACNASLPEQLVRLSCLGKRKSLRDDWLDFLLLQEVKQGDQILVKPCRLQPLECLDAVGDQAFAAREQPAANNVHAEDGGFTKTMATTRTT